MIVTNKKYEVLELYKKLNLIANKIIVLRIYKKIREYNDFILADLPQPTIIAETKDGYFLGYAINGKIHTKGQRLFYKHLSLRLKKTLMVRAKTQVENSSIWHLRYIISNGLQITTKNSYEMKYLAGHCLSLTTEEEKNGKLNNTNTKEEFAIYAGTYSKTEDALFDFIRYKAYDYKRINTINGETTTLEELTNYCLAIADLGYEIIGGKGISTAKAKAKNIAKWVFENYTGKKARKTHNNKELIVTRRERALLNSKERYNKVHKKISNLITGIFADEYKKSNGSWNISKLAEDVGCSRNTIYKHLQHLQKEGLI